LTIGRLAADLGISKGHLTELLPSKQALQIAALDAAMARFAEESWRGASALRRRSRTSAVSATRGFATWRAGCSPAAVSSMRRGASTARGRGRFATA
jgi:hypothetical protein